MMFVLTRWLGCARAIHTAVLVMLHCNPRSGVFGTLSGEQLDSLAVIAQPMIFDRGESLIQQVWRRVEACLECPQQTLASPLNVS